MNVIDTVHAEPGPGETRSPCCGLTLRQLPRTDWLSRNEAEVTCGKLTDHDIELLLGVPQAADQPATEQFVFGLTNRVRATCRARNHRASTTLRWR